MENSILYPQNLNNWRTELSTLNELFETDKALFSSESTKIKNILNFLDSTRIIIPAFSLSKTGKSTLFNALIGSDLLESNTAECTSFACKIRPILSEHAEPRFYSETDPKNVYEGKDKIKKRIEEINKQEKDSLKVWVLETRMFAFERDEEKQKTAEMLPFVEFVDVPGFDDNCLSKKDKKPTKEEKVFKINLNEIVKKIDFDGAILCFDVEKPNTEIKKFIKYFKVNIFKEENMQKMINCLNKNRICIVANKVDKFNDLKKEKREENVAEIQKLVFISLHDVLDPLKLKNSINKFKMQLSDVEEKQFQSNIMDIEKENKNEFENFLNEKQLLFISAKKALKSIVLTPEYLEKKKKKWEEDEESPEEIEKKIKDLIQKIKDKRKYLPSSGFNEFVNRIFRLLIEIYEDKIMNYVEKELQELRDKKKIYFDLKIELLQENVKDHPILKDYQNFFNKITSRNKNELMGKVDEKIVEYYQTIAVLKKDFFQNPKNFEEFHLTIQLLFQMLTILKNMHNAAEEVFIRWNEKLLDEISETKLAKCLKDKCQSFEKKCNRMMELSFNGFQVKLLPKGVKTSYMRCWFFYVFKFLISENQKQIFINHVGQYDNIFKSLIRELEKTWENFIMEYNDEIYQILRAYAKVNEIILDKN